jgi:hypothetical protein
MLLSCDCIVLNAIAEPHGRTALHYAVSWANATLVELLLFKRADLQIRDKANGLSAVDYALYFNDNNVLDQCFQQASLLDLSTALGTETLVSGRGFLKVDQTAKLHAGSKVSKGD